MDEAGNRELIGRALLGLLAEGRTVSYGAAADRAGVSKGLVQHYFPDRTRLVRFAASTLAARVRARVEAAVTADAPPAAVLADMLVALLPVSPETRLDEAAGRALFTIALTDPETGAAYREGRRTVNGVLADLVRAAAPGTDPQPAVRDLLGTLTEVATDLLLGDLDPDTARTLVRERVARATGEPPAAT
jgi:AcrR family transcriptional regulator